MKSSFKVVVAIDVEAEDQFAADSMVKDAMVGRVTLDINTTPMYFHTNENPGVVLTPHYSPDTQLYNRIHAVLDHVEIFDRAFELTRYYSSGGNGWHLHVVYDEPDIDNPTGPALRQRSRGWPIADTDSEDDIVATAYAAVMRSYDHVVREHFYYNGERVFSPHMHLRFRREAARAEGFVKK